MIDMAGAIPAILTKAKKLPVGHGLDLRTFKRDRSVTIRKTGEDSFEVIETGYDHNRFQSDHKGLKRLLKTLLKREFPRSNKIRVYELPAE